jgi:hypothetical protein
VNDTTTPPDAGSNLAEVLRFAGPGGYFGTVPPEDRAADPAMTAEVYDKLHGTWVHVYDGQWIIRGVQGELYPCAADVFAATYEAAEDAAAGQAGPSDAENAIGQAIREVESWAMTGNPLDPSEVQRVLLGIIFRQWLGGLRLPEVAAPSAGELEAIGTGPLLDPDCRAGKCSSCVGAPCEHECHKRQEAGRGR